MKLTKQVTTVAIYKAASWNKAILLFVTHVELFAASILTNLQTYLLLLQLKAEEFVG